MRTITSLILGSLSTDVFERRTSTGSGNFSSLILFFDMYACYSLFVENVKL